MILSFIQPKKNQNETFYFHIRKSIGLLLQKYFGENKFLLIENELFNLLK